MGGDTDQARIQRLLDFFRDLGEQYWGWQMESAKRGRGFKGALKEHFLPLLPQLRQLAANPNLAFGTSIAVQYQALCFMNRGLDECPPAAEDGDGDRYRMSLETAPYVVRMVTGIGNLNLNDYKDSLVCEMVKETLKLLDSLVGSAVSSRLEDAERLDCTAMLVRFVSSFHTLMIVSEHNSGLPGASGKLSTAELKPAVRALGIFVSFPEGSDVQMLQTTAEHLKYMGVLLLQNDPKLVEGVLLVFTSFLQSCSLLSTPECDQVLGGMMRPQGPVAPLVMHLLESASGNIHNLVASYLSSMCLLSGRVLHQMLGDSADSQVHAAKGVSKELSDSTFEMTDQINLLESIDRALEKDGIQVRYSGIMRLIETVLGCIVDGRKAAAELKFSASRIGACVILTDSDQQKRISDVMLEDDVQEIEYREMLDSDEIREDGLFRSRAVLGASDRRRAELEIRMQRLRRAKIARLEEAKSRRRHCGDGSGVAEGCSSRAGSSLPRDLATGTRVKRGPDWKWHSQDGGPGNQGVVVSGTDKNSDGWVRVHWDKGGVNGYRWGAENSYDVEPAHVSLVSTAVRNKDLAAVRELMATEDCEINEMHGSVNPLFDAINNADETPDETDVQIVVSLVKEFGVDPNLAVDCRLPLHLASERGRPDLVRVLLEHKADPSSKDGEDLDAMAFISRCIERALPDGAQNLYTNRVQVLRVLEDRIGHPSPIARHFSFEKEGGWRTFSRAQVGFRYPMPLQLNASFTVFLRIKHWDPTGIRSGRACLLSFGLMSESEDSRSATARGFSVFLHTRGHMQLGSGLCDKPLTSVNIAVNRGKWATVTVVYNSEESRLEVYVDGKLKAKDVVPNKLDLDSNGDILVGTPPLGVAKEDMARFHGTLSDVQLHAKALQQDELQELHQACRSEPSDTLPGLKTIFCDSICRTLLASLSRFVVETNGLQGSNSPKRQALAILSRVLPLCSGALLSGPLRAPLIRSMETLIAESETSLSQSKNDNDPRGAESLPCEMVSLLLCIDAVMNTSKNLFEEPFRRSGIVATILNLSQASPNFRSALSLSADAHRGVPYHLVHLPHDLALYLIENHFRGERGAAQATDDGKRIASALSDIRERLSSINMTRRSGGLHREKDTQQVLEQIAMLFEQPGVYSQELLASDLPATLVEFLAGDNVGDSESNFNLLESAMGGIGFGSDESAPLLKLMACLRLAVNKMPRDALPLLLHENGSSSDLRALKQWVSLRFAKCSSDASDLQELPASTEVRAEPLSLIKCLRSTLRSMLRFPEPGIGRRREERRGEMKAMVQAFGDDHDGAPSSLLEHMRHLVDTESRSHDTAPPIQRKLEALPNIHSWDGEIVITGTAKRKLRLSLTSKNQNEFSGGEGASYQAAPGSLSGSTAVISSDDDDEMQDLPASSPAARSRCSSAHSAATAREEDEGWKAPIVLEMYLCFGQVAHSAGQHAEWAGEIAMNECDQVQDEKSPPGCQWIVYSDGDSGACASLPSTSHLSASASHRLSPTAENTSHAGASDKSLEHGVRLEDGETLFEAMARLYALHSSAAAVAHNNGDSGAIRPASYVHPGQSWDRPLIVRYKRVYARTDEQMKTRDVCIDLPKAVVRHIIGRSEGSVRKIEHDTGVKIVKMPSGRNEAPMLKASGTQDQIDRAIKLIQMSAREAPSWHEARDAPIFEQLRLDGSTGVESGISCAQGLLNIAEGSSASCNVSKSVESGASELSFVSSIQQRSCLQLLNRLARRMEGKITHLRSFTVCASLDKYVSMQLDDALVVGSGLVSKLPWLLEICKLHANVSLIVRERYFVAGAFGPSRGLCTLQVKPDQSADDGDSSMQHTRAVFHAHNISCGRPRRYICPAPRRPHEVRVPELFHETIEIDHHRDGHEGKPSLMTWAEQILEAHSKRETVLDVTWKGEAGHGSGPTRKFFEKVAALLGSNEENVKCKVWRDVEDGNKCGLFPAELPDDNVMRENVLKRLRFIGLFVGKALQQRQMPGLCLAKPLFKMLTGKTVGFDDLRDMDLELSDGIENILQRSRICAQIQADQSLDELTRKNRLLDLDKDLSMFQNAAEEQVTHHNLDSYAQELVTDCVAKLRIDEQVRAMQEGIDAVFPWQMLCVFSATELQQKLWSDVEWDKTKLEKIVRPGPMWPHEQDQIVWLRRQLMGMETNKRRAFVKFVTASVCMPVETNPIVVHPQVATHHSGENGDNKLPTSRTCANILYLPAYSSATVLKTRLEQAIWEEHIEFD